MHPILTITLNPALDLASHAPKVEPGPKIRCSRPKVDPGGGGINVSRAIRILGGQSTALAALGGPNGDQVARLLGAEGIDLLRFDIAGETRQSFTVIDDANGQQFRFVTPGPYWEEADQQGILRRITELANSEAIFALSGSAPEGVTPDFARQLQEVVSARGGKVAADLSGAALDDLATHPSGLWLLRMDREEARALSGSPLSRRLDAAEFASMLVQQGVAEIVVIGRGPDGSVIATSEARFHARCPVDHVRSRTGAGDSLMAAMLLAFSRGETPQNSLLAGVAAASAAVMTDATALCRRVDVENLLTSCELSPL